MKKLLTIFFCLLLLTSCKKKQLGGIWMSVNNYSTTLIEFKNDSLFLTVLEYNYESMKDSFTYHIENDLLIIRNENFIDSSQFNIINDTILAFEKNDERFYKLNSKQYKTINLNDSLTGFYQVSSHY